MLKKFGTALIIGTLASISCAHRVDSPPISSSLQVIISDEFNGPEKISIAGGFDSWSAAVGTDLTFQYISADMSTINSGLSGTPPENTVYIIRVDDISTVDCLLMASNVACFKAPNRIFFQSLAISATGTWKRISAHEAGHALGLQHTAEYPSCMMSEIASMSDFPTPTDVDEYCRLHGCPNRQEVGNHQY